MQKSLLYALFCSILFTNYAFGQNIIHIPYQPQPQIDGTLSANEWKSSDSLFIDISGNRKVKVLYAHDSAHLHFAFVGNLESSSIRFPEVMLDIDHNAGTSWSNDDWWFHASGTDCESQGEPNNYDSCQLVRPNWTAERNFLQNTPPTDTVEIEIPFSTVGINISTVDTIGIAFDVTNTFSTWEFWPSTVDMDVPDTWADAVFLSEGTNGMDHTKRNLVKVYPNPAIDVIRFEEPVSGYYVITDINGKRVASGQLNLESKLMVDGLPSNGLYTFEITDHLLVKRGRFLKLK